MYDQAEDYKFTDAFAADAVLTALKVSLTSGFATV